MGSGSEHVTGIGHSTRPLLRNMRGMRVRYVKRLGSCIQNRHYYKQNTKYYYRLLLLTSAEIEDFCIVSGVAPPRISLRRRRKMK